MNDLATEIKSVFKNNPFSIVVLTFATAFWTILLGWAGLLLGFALFATYAMGFLDGTARELKRMLVELEQIQEEVKKVGR